MIGADLDVGEAFAADCKAIKRPRAHQRLGQQPRQYTSQKCSGERSADQIDDVKFDGFSDVAGEELEGSGAETS